MLEPVQVFATAIGVYFLLLAGFAAIAAAQALEAGDREGMPKRVYWSINKTTLFLGVPALIGLLLLLNSLSGSGQGSGVMTKDFALGAFFVFGMIGLLIAWIGAVTMGFVASAIVRNLSPTVAAGVLFLLVCGAPVYMAVVMTVGSAQNKRAQNHP